jgi:small subunit ribosomal protein S3
MGQKVNPKSFRLQVDHDWDSRWFAADRQSYRTQLWEDLRIREKINQVAGPQAAIARITIERTPAKTKVNIFTGRPGVLIGRSGQGIEKMTALVKKIIPGKVNVEVVEVRKPELSAVLVAQSIGQQITRRVAFRRAAKMTIQKVTQAGALGIKVAISGRVNGAEIARSEKFSEGSIPLSAIKSRIDFAVYHAPTTFGTIGVKVWIYRKPETAE